MKNKNKNLLTIVMSICLIALVVFVFIPKCMGDFLLEHRHFAITTSVVIFITCTGILVVKSKKLNVQNFVVDGGVLFDAAKEETKVAMETPVAEQVLTNVDSEEDDIIRLDYSFKSKLILSTDEVKDYYKEIVGHAESYGVKVRKSWKKETIYLGRNTFAILTFKGKKLCVSFALDPKDYENSKYYFKDVSDVKKFEKTPLLMKITSNRKVKYTKELLNLIFANNGLEDKKLEASIEEIPNGTKEKLIKQGLIKDPSKDKVVA